VLLRARFPAALLVTRWNRNSESVSYYKPSILSISHVDLAYLANCAGALAVCTDGPLLPTPSSRLPMHDSVNTLLQAKPPLFRAALGKGVTCSGDILCSSLSSSPLVLLTCPQPHASSARRRVIPWPRNHSLPVNKSIVSEALIRAHEHGVGGGQHPVRCRRSPDWPIDWPLPTPFSSAPKRFPKSTLRELDLMFRAERRRPAAGLSLSPNLLSERYRCVGLAIRDHGPCDDGDLHAASDDLRDFT
jgi:hypothetical protein